jgi:hypothetical protein
MDIKNYLKSIDIDYRIMSRKVEEMKQRNLTESEEAELDIYEKLLKEKEDEITLNRD